MEVLALLSHDFGLLAEDDVFLDALVVRHARETFEFMNVRVRLDSVERRLIHA
jgi:hypothetical protein